MNKNTLLKSASLGVLLILSACDGGNTSDIRTVAAQYSATNPEVVADGEVSKTNMQLEISDVESYTVTPQ